MLERAANAYRPPEVTALQEEIAGRIRALELRVSVLGLESVTQEDIDEVTMLRLKLDGLYFFQMLHNGDECQ